MEVNSVNKLKNPSSEAAIYNVVLHRPPSGKSSLSRNPSARNRRLRMPLPPQNDTDVRDTPKVKADVPVLCPSPPPLPKSPIKFGGERIRPQSANAVLSSVKPAAATPDVPDVPKKTEKVFFSPVVEILNPPMTKVSAFKVNNLQLDLEDKDLPIQALPEKSMFRKSHGETRVAFGRCTSDPGLLGKFLENTSQHTCRPNRPSRPSSATTYSQNFGAFQADFSTSCHQRPASASILRKSSVTESNPDCDKSDSGSGLEPFVYGFKSNKVMCGSETDLNNTCIPNTEEFTPYKMSEPPAEVVVNKEKETADNQHQCSRNVPETLEPLIPWLTEGLPLHWTGIDSSDCLMFIPSLQYYQDDLPVVPAPHGLMDDLPHKEVVLPKETWNPKKYTHPSFARAQDWQCKHNKTEVRLYNKEGILLYERYQGTRTRNVVRKEIIELEKLMNGIGTDGSDCMVVQLQADITRLRRMVKDTLKLADNPLFKRPVSPEPTDYFGLRKFYQDHDEIMNEIKHQHSICVQELALIENKLELDENLKHFNKVVTQKLGEVDVSS